MAGRLYGGRTDLPSGVWHQANRRFWTSGMFAFSADPGRLRLTVRADGYAPVTVERDLRAGGQESLAIALKPLFDPAAAGWYKGDFHAHGVHGERFYDVNIPMIAFMLRAEHYRWFYLSSDFNNDGVRVDAASRLRVRAAPIFCSERGVSEDGWRPCRLGRDRAASETASLSALREHRGDQG